MIRPPLIGIRHVALYVTDLDAAELFWTSTMGYEVEWRPDPDNVYLRGGSDNLALHRGRPAGAHEGAGVLDHIGIAVGRPDDVDSWATYLAGRGVVLKTQPKTHRDGSRSIYVRGPEDLTIQIIFHSPMSTPAS